ncbi:MAG TPA: hypothetical protein DDY98_03865 [Ruminococcaceae bacterium]|nr:hypothetical protein [Oscillospiraceae bacterium]
MANCPKCNAHLKITDWRPECPHCGVNMVYYGMEDRLLADAEKAEAEHALFQKKIDRMKASLVGGPLQIARLVFAFLPIAGLFLTLAKFNLSDAPYMAAKTVSANVLTLVDFFSNIDFDALLGTFESGVFGQPMLFFALSLVIFALTIVLGLIGFFRLFCSAQKKSCIKNIVVSAFQLIFIAASCVLFNKFSSGIATVFPAYITASVGFGVYVYAALHLPTVIANVIFTVKPMKVKYKVLPDYTAEDAAMEATEEAEKAEANA